jgi:hypothetical protein
MSRRTGLSASAVATGTELVAARASASLVLMAGVVSRWASSARPTDSSGSPRITTSLANAVEHHGLLSYDGSERPGRPRRRPRARQRLAMGGASRVGAEHGHVRASSTGTRSCIALSCAPQDPRDHRVRPHRSSRLPLASSGRMPCYLAALLLGASASRGCHRHTCSVAWSSRCRCSCSQPGCHSSRPESRMTVAGVSLSVAGLTAAAGLSRKAPSESSRHCCSGATTQVRDLLDGLRRLRDAHSSSRSWASWLGYVEVVGADLAPHARSRCSRAGSTRAHPAQWPVLARALGALFVRSYERGERVHVAMMSRGLPQCVQRVESAAP